MKEITAAGTVALKPRGEGKDPRILLVHRPSYDDWTLPKGKLDPDEYLAACAHRETLEETAIQVRLGIPVDMINYPVSAGSKTVHYWRSSVVTEARHKANSEVDRVAWLTVRQALKRMTYADERSLVEQAITLPESTPLLIVRHGKAMERKHWTGRDQARQLNGRGRKQSQQLIPLLNAYGIEQLASSTSNRCMATLAPYAKEKRTEVRGWATLSEEQAKDNLKAVETLMKRLARSAADSGVPMAVCGHRPVLPTMLKALGIPNRHLQPAAVIVAHLNPKGETLAVEFHKPRI